MRIIDRLKALIYIVYFQHKLQLRWLLSEFVGSNSKRLKSFSRAVLMVPVIVFLITYLVVKYQIKDIIPFDSNLYGSTLVAAGGYLFIRGYKAHFFRAFFPKDLSLYLNIKNDILLAKLIDTYFLNIILYIYPVLFGILIGGIESINI